MLSIDTRLRTQERVFEKGCGGGIPGKTQDTRHLNEDSVSICLSASHF